MENKTTVQRAFNVLEYTEKIRAALKKLKETQQPGQSSGVGTKTDVLLAAKKEIVEMLDGEYTSKQIADAIKDDVFGILPKTITDLFTKKPTTKQATKPVTNKVMNTKRKGKAPTGAPAGAPAEGAPGTINVKQDTEGL